MLLEVYEVGWRVASANSIAISIASSISARLMVRSASALALTLVFTEELSRLMVRSASLESTLAPALVLTEGLSVSRDASPGV